MSFLTDLAEFAFEAKFKGKGPLSIALVVNEQAKSMSMPLNPKDFETEEEGQVRGAGGDAAQAILDRHGVTRRLSTEGGRTSRGSLAKMRAYVAFLNAKSATPQMLDEAEKFWVNEVTLFFSGKPFVFKVNVNHGLKTAVRDLMKQATERQKAMPGTMFLGTVMQHLVGAKLDLVLGDGIVQHNNSNANDEKAGRTGDFDLGDTSIHVSTAPSEALVRKCGENIAAGRRPIIVTTQTNVTVAEALAVQAGIGDSVDVLDFEQFLASNLYEHGRFTAQQRRTKIDELVARYNKIVATHETDPSLNIEVAQGR